MPQQPVRPPQMPSAPPQMPSRPDTMPDHRPQGSGFDARLLGSLPIAMAYVPMQQWKTTYSQAEALHRGTVFPELDLPFEGRMLG